MRIATTLAALMAAATACLGSGSDYPKSIEDWRLNREQRLKADDGWLTVAGLFWLKEGTNSAGSAPDRAIRLPRGPAHLGDFELHAGKVAFHPAERPGASTGLRSDADNGGPDPIKLDDMTMYVIRRGDRFGIRLKDKQSEYRREFTGLHWFPIREEYRIVAHWTAYDQPHKITVPNILGQTDEEPTPGYASFKLHGVDYRLDPVTEGDQLFFIFRDQTSGKETYGAGRFLYADLPKNGTILLDFNKAQNPPCAFTPYATCPLPPKQNRLSVRVEAGELNYGHH